MKNKKYYLVSYILNGLFKIINRSRRPNLTGSEMLLEEYKASSVAKRENNKLEKGSCYVDIQSEWMRKI